MRGVSVLFASSTAIAGILHSAELSWINGSEFDNLGQSFYYTALTAGKEFKKRWRVMGRVWLDHLTYRFTASDTRVTAKAPAFQVVGGVGYVRNGWRANIFAGYEKRTTEVDPDLPEIKIKGSVEGVALLGEAHLWFGKSSSVNFILSYSTGTSYIWGMVSASRELLFKSFRMGVEAIGQGNPDYRAFQGGIKAGIGKGSFFSGVRGGYKDSSTGRGAYAGFELYVGF